MQSIGKLFQIFEESWRKNKPNIKTITAKRREHTRNSSKCTIKIVYHLLNVSQKMMEQQ